MPDSARSDILLVEDNPQDLELTLRALRKGNLNGTVRVVRDGAEALDLIFGAEGAPSGMRDLPKLIVLDLKIPKVGGLEVLKRLKSDPRTRTVPVVVLTSSREPRDVDESYGLGVNSYVVKPVSFEEFAAAVRDIGHYWLRLNQPPNLES
jgi:CheY-like chemotaxis protein